MPLPECPQCGGDVTYQEGNLYICPMCFYEWTAEDQEATQEAEMIRDANGNPLEEGDDVIVIRDLKMGKETIKQGTKAKNIHILDVEMNGHDIQGRIDGIGTIYLKSSVVKK